jgi:resuscitation-promoting factor RpfA
MSSRPGSRKGRSLMRAALVGAVAVGAPFVASGTANAAPDSAWDKLAQCESGGNWKINTGNGYYGGLQFNMSTWRAYCGEGSPHGASRAQQIAVAERTLAAQGWAAWPQCSRKAGVRGHSASPGRVVKAVEKTAPAAATPAAASAPAAPVVKNGVDYTVAKGDTLGKIAQQFDVPGGWKAVYQRNADVLSNPDVLRVGQQLDLR